MNFQFFFAGLLAGLLLAAAIYYSVHKLRKPKPPQRQCRAVLSNGARCAYLMPLDDERAHEGPHLTYLRGREFNWRAPEDSVADVEIMRVR